MRGRDITINNRQPKFQEREHDPKDIRPELVDLHKRMLDLEDKRAIEAAIKEVWN